MKMLPLFALAAAAAAAPAHAGILYANDFQNPATAFDGLTAGGTLSALSTASLPTDSGGIGSVNQSTWLGKLGAGVGKSPTVPESVSLQVNGLVAGQQYTVGFDLLIGASWDGSASFYGPDQWRLTAHSGANSTVLVDATFANGAQGINFGAYSPQSYSDATPTAGSVGSNARFTGADASFSLNQNGNYASDYSIYSFGHGAGNPVLTFTAGANAVTLVFERLPIASGDSSDEYWALDNVKVASTAVPVPAAAWLFAPALGMLAARRRARTS